MVALSRRRRGGAGWGGARLQHPALGGGKWAGDRQSPVLFRGGHRHVGRRGLPRGVGRAGHRPTARPGCATSALLRTGRSSRFARRPPGGGPGGLHPVPALDDAALCAARRRDQSSPCRPLSWWGSSLRRHSWRRRWALGCSFPRSPRPAAVPSSCSLPRWLSRWPPSSATAHYCRSRPTSRYYDALLFLRELLQAMREALQWISPLELLSQGLDAANRASWRELLLHVVSGLVGAAIWVALAVWALGRRGVLP